jgi:hypothetical protein
MTAIADAAQEVRVLIPEVTKNVLHMALLAAAREYCRRSLAWRSRNLVNTIAGTSSYEFWDPLDAIIVDIFSPKLDTDISLTKAPDNKVDLIDMELLTKQDEPEYIFFNGVENSVQLAPIPDAAYALTAQVALMPLPTSTVLNDDLWNRHSDAIIDGTLYRLYRMPNKSWSSQPLAGYHRVMFEDAIDHARSKAADGNMTGVPRKVRYGGL